MATYGVSTNETKFYYGISDDADTLPTGAAMKRLTRINEVGGVTVSNENIDASALEDGETHNIKGRSSVDDTKTVTVNVTNETLTEWENLISEFNARTTGQVMWVETVDPGISKASWTVIEPPSILPDPDRGQNELLVMEIDLTVVKHHGRDTVVLPTT